MYTKPACEVADIFRLYADEYLKLRIVPAAHRKVINALIQCRTAALGGHIDKCDNNDCSHIRISYDSCRNRHCPKCNSFKRIRWLLERKEELLPVKYFHVVFTLPAFLDDYCLKYPEKLYYLLFKSAWDTLNCFGHDPKHLGAQTGMIAVLHTWGQTLYPHTHLHCIVPAGGITKAGYWKHGKIKSKKSKRKKDFIFPVKALSPMFRGKFRSGLQAFIDKGDVMLNEPWKTFNNKIHKYKWVVDARDPMDGPEKVIDYLGKYVNRIAISNHRIKSIEHGKVIFSYTNYRTCKTGQIMQLEATEFIHRFLLHVLPKGFYKIRHYGILSNRNKANVIKNVRNEFGVKVNPEDSVKHLSFKELFQRITGCHPDLCPKCKKGMYKIIKELPPIRGDPTEYIKTVIKKYA